MRIVFMGTPDFACPSLRALVTAGHDIAAVVTQPDRPGGRGGELQALPVKRLAQELGLPVLQPPRLRRPEAVAQLQALRPDLLVTAAFGQILSAEVLAIPVQGALNVHASLLPRYRGAAPIHRAVMAGAAETGVTIMWMDAGLDTGDILLQRAMPIAAAATTGEVHDGLAELGAGLLVAAVALIAAVRAPHIPQDPAQATYAAKLTRADERIDWTAPAAVIVNQVRGLNPWPGAYTGHNGRILKVWRAEELSASGPDAAPGTCVALRRGQGPAVATAGGAVVLREVQPGGRRRMAGDAWAAGARVQVGDRFAAPAAAEDG